MKKVYIRYPNDSCTKELKFKVASTTNGAVLRTYIGHHIPQFRSSAYILVHSDTFGRTVFLDEAKPLSLIAQTKRVRLRLVLRRFRCTAARSDGTSFEADIDLTESVRANLSAIAGTECAAVLCFSPRSAPDQCRVLAEDLPLLCQGWAFESLLILNRVTAPSAASADADFSSLRTAAARGLSLYSAESWGALALLQFLGGGGNVNLSARSSLAHFVPESLRGDSTVARAYLSAQSEYGSLSAPAARARFVELAVTRGPTYCYTERVKFIVAAKKRKTMSNRFVYISDSYVSITKQCGCDVLFSEKLANIAEVSLADGFVCVALESGIRWRLRSEHPDAVAALLRRAPPPSAPRADIAAAIGDAAAQPASDSDAAIIDAAPPQSPPPRAAPADALSPLVCPARSDSDAPFSDAPQMFRDLAIASRLAVPNAARAQPPPPAPNGVLNELLSSAPRLATAAAALAAACALLLLRICG